MHRTIYLLVPIFLIVGCFFAAGQIPKSEGAIHIWGVLADSFFKAVPFVGVIVVLAPLLMGVIVAYRRIGADDVIKSHMHHSASYRAAREGDEVPGTGESHMDFPAEK